MWQQHPAQGNRENFSVVYFSSPHAAIGVKWSPSTAFVCFIDCSAAQVYCHLRAHSVFCNELNYLLPTCACFQNSLLSTSSLMSVILLDGKLTKYNAPARFEWAPADHTHYFETDFVLWTDLHLIIARRPPSGLNWPLADCTVYSCQIRCLSVSMGLNKSSILSPLSDPNA